MLGCGSSKEPAKASSARKEPDGPISAAEWEGLCETQSARAKKCPGPPPEPIEDCTHRLACLGAIVRPDVIRGLGKCQAQTGCSRPCSVDRVTASLPPTPTTAALEEACASRRMACPDLDCNAIVRPARSLDTELAAPVVDCLKFERTCLDVATCVLDRVAVVNERVARCGPVALTDAGAEP